MSRHNRNAVETASNLSFPGALMPFYPVMPPDATPGCAEDAALGLPGRLGVAEQRLDKLCGIPGVIDQVARSAVLDGRVKGTARRAMSPALAIRFTLLMTLIPDAGYAEVLQTLLGDLVLVPWQRPCRVPTAAVACTWRPGFPPGGPRLATRTAPAKISLCQPLTA
jgi:hypothetical protein